MKKAFVLIFFTWYCTFDTEAQFSRYIVTFKNKAGTPFTFSNPEAYLSQKAIQRRRLYNIPIDSTDLPVNPSYVAQVSAVPHVTLLNISRWQNAITIQTHNASAVAAIAAFPFVQSINPVAARPVTGGKGHSDKFEKEEYSLPPAEDKIQDITANYYNYGTASFNEINLHNGQFLHNIGLRGQGMTIAMLDAGFFNYTQLRAFDSAIAAGQIKSTWDFVARHASVTEDHPHGMQCLSTIAANIPGQFVGKAPQANFHLFRTEDVASEYPIEEFNWVCGAERADSLGCDVISSSLGYYYFDNSTFNYTYAHMNGNTTISAIGADLAAKKGMLVFSSVGNEGNSTWRYLISPSDGDSVVAVGAVSAAGYVGSFSSYGPSSDGQIKPDVASIGVAALIQTTANTVGISNGTSFACPNMAGLATCLWQGFPEFNNMKIVQALRQAGHKAGNPDDRVGYGIPNMKLAFASLLTEYATSSASVNGCRVTLNWNSKDVGAMKYIIERKAPGEIAFAQIGELNAKPGDVLAVRSYRFTNDLSNGSYGNYSYRIRQVIDTSTAGFTAVYIDTADVSISTPCKSHITSVKNTVIVQPNPSGSNILNVVVETAQSITHLTIMVYDAKGRLVMQLKSSKGMGKKIIELPAHGLAKGVYYIRVFDGSSEVGKTSLVRL